MFQKVNGAIIFHQNYTLSVKVLMNIVNLIKSITTKTINTFQSAIPLSNAK